MLVSTSTRNHQSRYLTNSTHSDLCAIEYSFGDARTALKHVDEACLHIWHLPLPTYHANYWLIKWFCWQFFFREYDFWPSEQHRDILDLLEKIHLSSFFSKINWSYNRHDVSATIWDQKFLIKSDFHGSDCLHLDIKRKVSPMASTWWTWCWPTIYIRQMMTLKLNLAYN